MYQCRPVQLYIQVHHYFDQSTEHGILRSPIGISQIPCVDDNPIPKLAFNVYLV